MAGVGFRGPGGVSHGAGGVILRFPVEDRGLSPIETRLEWAFGRLGQASTMTAFLFAGRNSAPSVRQPIPATNFGSPDPSLETRLGIRLFWAVARIRDWCNKAAL